MSNLIQITSTFSPDIASQQGFGEKIGVKRVLKNKLKIGGVLDFTADFELKVRNIGFFYENMSFYLIVYHLVNCFLPAL